MANGNVFGAVRASTIAALCAGAGLALAGCTAEEPAASKPGAPATEKPAGDHQCGGDHKCGGDKSCGAADKPK